MTVVTETVTAVTETVTAVVSYRVTGTVKAVTDSYGSYRVTAVTETVQAVTETVTAANE